jgi:hypothetical protein
MPKPSGLDLKKTLANFESYKMGIFKNLKII